MHARNKDNTVSNPLAPEDITGHLELIGDELTAVKQCICSQLVSSDDSINAMLDHVGSRSGKMLRPAFFLFVAKICGQITETHIKIAAVVELLHAATLLHDDVLDEAQSRRKTSTANHLWGNEAAVLLGDFLLGKVFVMCSEIEPREVSQVLSNTAVQICQGELSQNIQRNNFDLSEEQYFEIVRDKTAALFGTCCYLGSLVSGGDRKRHEAFRRFGLNIGMAFQITDDLLDIIGDEADVGKTLGTDIAHNKMTLPIIHMLNATDPDDRNDLITKLSEKMEPQQLRQMLDNTDSLDYTRTTAEGFCTEAIELLEQMYKSREADILARITKSVAGRYI